MRRNGKQRVNDLISLCEWGAEQEQIGMVKNKKAGSCGGPWMSTSWKDIVHKIQNIIFNPFLSQLFYEIESQILKS